MKYLTPKAAHEAKRHGDIVWAIHEAGTEKPICVMLTTYATKEDCEGVSHDAYTNYMHRYDPATKTVTWKEWLNPNFYQFADTEEEIVEMHNQKIQRSINDLRNRAKLLTTQLIPVPGDTEMPSTPAVNRYAYSTRFITNINEISRLYHQLPDSIASKEQKETFLKHYNNLDFHEISRMVKAAIELETELSDTDEFMHDTITDAITAILLRRFRDCQNEIISDICVKLQYIEIAFQTANDIQLALQTLRIQSDIEAGRMQSAAKRLNKFKDKLSNMGQDTCDDRNVYTHISYCLDAMNRLDI